MNKKMLMFIAAVTTVAATLHAEIPTPTAVRQFYIGICDLANTYDNDKANEIETVLRNCFGSVENSGMTLPNDFRNFDYDNDKIAHTHISMNSNNYINRLDEYAFKDKVLKANINIGKSEMGGKVPDFLSTRLSSSDAYIITYVRKTYFLNGTKQTFNDTVRTSINTGLILGISNRYGLFDEDKNALRIKAAIAYERKSYQEAYEYYEQIIFIDHNDADAYYRLGLMTYWMQGCESKFRKKRDAHKKGKEYLEMAQTCGRWSSKPYDIDISIKAEHVLHYLAYPNQY